MVQLSKHGVMSIFQNPKDISPHPSQKFKRICIFCWDHLFPLAVGAPRITSPLYALPSPPSRSTILYYILYLLTCCTPYLPHREDCPRAVSAKFSLAASAVFPVRWHCTHPLRSPSSSPSALRSPCRSVRHQSCIAFAGRERHPYCRRH